MINFFTKLKKEKSAFSLIEVSIVLTILAVIVSSSISISKNSSKNAKIQITKERMLVIEAALEAYVQTSRRLPCPSSLVTLPTSTSYGVQNIGSSTCSNTVNLGSAGSSNASASSIFYGAVPARTLGIALENMIDGFGNKFSYAVCGANASIGSATLQTIYTSPTFGFRGGNFGTATTTTNNVISIRSTQTASLINGKIVYVIISHGPNGYGAVNAYGTTQNSISGAVADEANNYFVTNFDNVFISASSDSAFDDILVYNDRDSIVSKIGSLGF